MKFNLIWKAIFNDGTELNQFDDKEQKNENLFRKVLERQDQLKEFCLFNIITGKKYRVDLSLGIISIGNKEIEKDQLKDKPNIRLIYFRRIEKEFQLTKDIDLRNGGKIKSISYFLGYQYTENNTNHKSLIQIFDNDEIIIY